jgi:multiple sugar transport system substrate-binding protein
MERNKMVARKLSLCLVVAVLIFGGSLATAQDVKEIRFGTINDPAVERVNQLLVENFKAAHPDVEVKVEYIPGADLVATYTAQATAGTLPDVIWLADLFVVPFSQSKIVFDMQPLAEADKSFDLTDIYDNLLGLSRVDGKGLYMIPSSYDVVTMYYNKTMFEAAGAPLPTAEWTWDDYIAACKTIKEKTGNYCFANGGGLPTFDWWAWVVPFVSGYGGKLLSDDGKTVMLNTEETLAGFQAYVDLWAKHGVAQPLDFDAGGNCFVVGKCATAFFIPGFMSAIRALEPQPFAWDVQVVPSHPKGKFTGMGTYGYAVSANAKSPELAWDFVKHLASADAQKAIASNYAGTPLLRSLREDPAITNLAAPPENITAFIQNGENGILPTYFPGNCGSLYAGQISQEIKDALEAAILGASSVKDAFDAANKNIQACLDKG